MSEKQLQTTAHELFELYDRFKLSQIRSRRFTQDEMLTWLKPFVEKETCRTTVVGTSAEGRTISLLTSGHGATSVLLWSQMHGD